MVMLGGGESVKNKCRKPEIMSDAAYVILTNDEASNSGNFYIDDEVLKKHGVTDFQSYSYKPGNSFIDGNRPERIIDQ